MPDGSLSSAPRTARLAEAGGMAVLAVSAVIALTVSWRKWPDPVIDAGHQLYTAWRLAEGAVLYRDVGCLYGPLSSYWNALLFRVFGPGMMVLVWANLVVYAVVALLAYRLFRAAYGAWPAFCALAIFVAIFSFNQLTPVGNSTYALPYAHESTHGVLISLAVILAAHGWLVRSGSARAAALGLLCGLTVVLKPEFILLATLVLFTSIMLRRRAGRPIVARDVGLAALAATLPVAGFTLHFWRHLPLAQAFAAANRAWWTVVVSRVHAAVWSSFVGADAPLRNLATMALATALLATALGVIALGARGASRGFRLAVLLVPLPCVIGLAEVAWIKAALAIPLVLLAVLAVRITRAMRSGDEQNALRLLVAVAAFALLARMILYPRFFHFGFFQAALATMVVVAEILVRLDAAAHPRQLVRLVVRCSTGLVMLAACLDIFLASRALLSLRTFPVGVGRDAFLAFPPEHDASGLLVERITQELRRRPAADRVLAVPEGLMINYLARRKSPVAEWIFIDLTLAGPGESALVAQLAADPPEWVVLISRDLREHGIRHFGAPGQPGEHMMAFFAHRFRVQLALGDDDPFAPGGQGARLLRRAD